MRNRMAQPVEWLQGCAAAFQLLTRIPIPVQLDYNDRLFRRSAVFYPIVGAVLGLLLLVAAILLSLVLPPLPVAVLVLGLWLALTGGLHMDGLMDTADGVLSHRSRERMLEIMKDSRVGAMGVLAGGWQLLLKTAVIYSLLEYTPDTVCMPALVLAPIWSRTCMVGAIAGWPYARAGEGMGRLMAAVTLKEAGLAALLATGLTAASLLLVSDIVTAFWHTAVLAAFTIVVGWWIARYIARKLGGLTGDTYGAINELLESALLLLAAGWGYSIIG